jgi:membrane protease YdiL (CAAX protease family)
LSQLIISGGLAGLAESVEVSGVSLEAELFTAALMTALAFLGIGMAIHRMGQQSLARLGLRVPTVQDVVWGIGVGVGLYGVLIVLAVIWSAIVPPEQIVEQSAAAEQIAQAFNTIPLAFALSLAAAVSEEILFRGALQPVFGLIPTSLFFALVHIQYTLTPATLIIFVVALGLGLLRQRQSTTAAIIAHFIYNFVQLSLAILAAGALGANT